MEKAPSNSPKGEDLTAVPFISSPLGGNEGGRSLRAVLFDMDGVLYNSMPYHAKAWHRAMAQFGYDLPEEEVYMHEGRTGASTVNLVSMRQRGVEETEERIQEIYQVKSEFFNEYPPADPMPGALDLLRLEFAQ